MVLRLWMCCAAAFSLPGFVGPVAAQPGLDSGPAEVRPWVEVRYPRSGVIAGVEFDLSTHRTHAPGSDIWPITWADDDHQYAAFGDGGGFGGTNSDGRVSLGVSRIEGGPENYVGKNVWGGKYAENSAQFTGKGTSILSIDGVLYMWVAQPGSQTVPRTRLAVSRDHSRSWTLADWQWTMQDGVYAGAFINFGRDYHGAPDDFVYAAFVRLAEIPETPRNWIHETPGRLDLARAPKDRLLDKSAWEWLADVDPAGDARWTSDIRRRRHIFEDPNGIKVVSLCHHARLDRYLLVYNPRDNGGNFALFEAPRPWGPWHRVEYLKEYPRFMPPRPNRRVSIFHFAPKWWSEDGRKFTLVFNTGDDAWNTMNGRLLLK